MIISYQQRRIFQAELNNPGSYTVITCFDINNISKTSNLIKDNLVDNIDETRVIYAIDKIIERHIPIRTTFFSNGSPKVLSTWNTTIKKIDKTESENLMSEKYQFDLFGNNPLIQPFIVNVGVKQVFMCLMHHISFDAWSCDIFKKEFAHYYYSNEDLPPLKVTYQDFCKEESKVKKEIYEWWKTKNIMTYEMDLPFQSLSGSKYAQTYLLSLTNENDLQQWNKWCKIYRLSNYNLFQFLLSILLHCITDQTKILTFSLLFNRNMPGYDKLIGMFGNIVPFVYNVNENDTIDSFFRLARQEYIKLLSKSNTIIVDTIYKKLPQVMTSPLFLEQEEVPNGQLLSKDVFAKFDLNIDIIAKENHITIRWIFRKERFISTQIELYAKQLFHILKLDPSTSLKNVKQILNLESSKDQYFHLFSQNT